MTHTSSSIILSVIKKKKNTRGRPQDQTAKVQDCDLEASKFQLQSHYNVHLQTYTLWKSTNILII